MSVRRRLAEGGEVTAVQLSWPTAGMAEAIADLGADCLVADGEHGALDDTTVEDLARVAELRGLPLVVRTARRGPELARWFDFGVDGVQIPFVAGRADVDDVVQAITFPPHGRRGLGAGRARGFGLRTSSHRDHVAAAWERTLVVAQIEDAGGLAALPEVLAHPRVDAVVVGAVDLSVDLGVPGEVGHPRVQTAVDAARTAIVASDKALGAAVATASALAAARADGARYLVTTTASLLQLGARQLLGRP